LRDYFDPLPATAPTIARDLRTRGYLTAFFGKWHLGRRDPAEPLVGEAHARTLVPPEARGGFEFWEGFESGFLLNDPYLHGTHRPEPTQFHGYQSDVLCGQAGEWLRRDGPWFAMVSLEAPHPPYAAPSAGVRPRPAGEMVLPANVPAGTPAADRARRELAGYHAHIEATDRAIGRLVAGLRRDTVIVVTSVHGDMHGAHGLFRKGWPHEESVRVPLLVRVPGVAPRRDDAAVSLLDLPAMTRAWADRVAPPALPRRSEISMPSVVALPDQCDRVWRGWRSPARKLVLNADGTPWLYFDLERDPGELKNLAEDPARAGEIATLRTAD
jgi:arylsulfatase A-like enzyme